MSENVPNWLRPHPLPSIPAPAGRGILVCGDRDRWFAKEVHEETARLIPDCTLKLYPGKGHLGAMSDRRFPQDVLDFVRQHPKTPGAARGLGPARLARYALPFPGHAGLDPASLVLDGVSTPGF